MAQRRPGGRLLPVCLGWQNGEERQLEVARSRQAHVAVAPRGHDRPLPEVGGTGRGQPLGRCGRIGHLERDPDRPGDPPPDLDRVDQPAWASSTSSRVARPAARTAPRPCGGGPGLDLRQAEDVAIEGERPSKSRTVTASRSSLTGRGAKPVALVARGSAPARSAQATNGAAAPGVSTCPARHQWHRGRRRHRGRSGRSGGTRRRRRPPLEPRRRSAHADERCDGLAHRARLAARNDRGAVQRECAEFAARRAGSPRPRHERTDRRPEGPCSPRTPSPRRLGSRGLRTDTRPRRVRGREAEPPPGATPRSSGREDTSRPAGRQRW